MPIARGARLAVDHLVALGHREIVHVDGGTQPGAADRRRGYRTAMRRHGLAELVRVLPVTTPRRPGPWRPARCWGNRLPTAVFAANDRCAHGLLFTLVRAGVAVPERVSVVGYDDSRVARLSFLDLTSIRQDAAETAGRAVRAVAERLEGGRTTPSDIVLEPTVVVRGSTGPRTYPMSGVEREFHRALEPHVGKAAGKAATNGPPWLFPQDRTATVSRSSRGSRATDSNAPVPRLLERMFHGKAAQRPPRRGGCGCSKYRPATTIAPSPRFWLGR